jgi:hypothetical protein
MITRIKVWNQWRKRSMNKRFYKLMVLFGLVKSPTFRMELVFEEARRLYK